jgi:hypothetical protein
MPISENGVGYSDETQEKIATVHEVANWQYGIVRSIWLRRWKRYARPFYYHVDAYCGTGLNPEDCKESASLQFLRRLRKEPFQSDAVLVDNGKERNSGVPNIESMRAMLTEEELREVRLSGQSNQLIIPRILRSLKHMPLGMIFLDPNGVKDLPHLLPAIAEPWQGQKMDILIHVGTTAIKRARQAGGSCKDYQWYLDDILELARKDRGFIKRSPCQHGQGWFFILLTSARAGTFKQWAQKGWHDLDTRLGRYLRQIANYTETERKQLEEGHQPVESATLFDLH